MILVPGTIGTEEENHFNSLASDNMSILFRAENGGLHRGGIRGSNTVELSSIKDADLNEEQIRNNNLLLFGTVQTNSVLKRYRNKLPVAFEPGAIRLGDRTYFGERVAVLAMFPHPDHPRRAT